MLVGFIPTLTVTIPAKVSLKWLAPENAHVILTVYVYSMTQLSSEIFYMSSIFTEL